MAKKKTEDTSEADELRRQRREAVAKAREALGPKKTVAEYSTYIKDTLGLEVENKVIGIHLRHLSLDPQKKQKAAAANSSSPKPGRSGEISFSEIRQFKELLTRHGTQRIRDLIELLS